MVKHIQSVFDHFVGLALNKLNKHTVESCVQVCLSMVGILAYTRHLRDKVLKAQSPFLMLLLDSVLS